MKKSKIPKIAFVEPSILGHKYRGIGVYSRNLLKKLNNSKSIFIEKVSSNYNPDNFDLIHYPFFDLFFLTLPFFKKGKRVVTVHDLIPLKYPKFFPSGIRGRFKWKIQKRSLMKCEAILTDSKASKKDIAFYTGIQKEKIHVVYLGVDSRFQKIKSEENLKKTKEKFKLPDEYLLHVGDVNYNKNIPRLISAFSMIKKTRKDLKLVLLGRGFVKKTDQLTKIVSLIKVLGLESDVMRIGAVDTEDLVSFYNMASIYMQVSLAEGFGLPVLEAMACGCPVVVSDRSSLPEIIGKAGFKTDSENIEDIVDKIKTVFNLSSSEYEKQIKKGVDQASKFTWEKCAANTIKLYKKILNSKY